MQFSTLILFLEILFGRKIISKNMILDRKQVKSLNRKFD